MDGYEDKDWPLVYTAWLCANCDNWHSKFLGFLDPERRIAEAGRIIGESQVEHGSMRQIGLIVLNRTGPVVSLIRDGAVMRVTRSDAITQPTVLEVTLDRGLCAPTLQALEHSGETTLYTDTNWTRILTDVLRGEEEPILGTDELMKLWER